MRLATGGLSKDISTKFFFRTFILVRPAERQVLGYLLLGYEIDDRVARDLSRVAASEVAFRYGDMIVRSTLKPTQESELLRVPRGLALEARRKEMRSGWGKSVSWLRRLSWPRRVLRR